MENCTFSTRQNRMDFMHMRKRSDDRETEKEAQN